jgi:hypothetical protein
VYSGDMNPTDSTITTEVQRALGQRLTQATTPLRCGERTIHQGVEIPVTASGRY